MEEGSKGNGNIENSTSYDKSERKNQTKEKLSDL